MGRGAGKRLRPFRSRVGRRILVLFFLSALAPVVAVGVWAYVQVGNQLASQGEERLREAAKTSGMTAVQRLTLVDEGLQAAGTQFDDAGEYDGGAARRILRAQREMLEGVALVRPNTEPRTLLGEPVRAPGLEAEQRRRLDSGRPVVATRSAGAATELLLGRALAPDRPARGVLWARIDQDRLWGTGGSRWELPRGVSDLCVLTADGTLLHCTLDGGRAALSERVRRLDGGTLSFRWRGGGRRQVAGASSLFMEANFGAPSWTVVVSEPMEAVLAPVTGFRREYLLLLAATLLVVLFLSNVQIRRSLVPLQRLMEGTRRVAAGDFGARVKVESEDEFRDLATSFNRMAGRVRRQIQTLTTLNEVDRSILSELDTEQIVATVVTRAAGLVGARGSRLLVLDAPGAEEGWLFEPDGGDDTTDGLVRSRVELSTGLRERLATADEPLDADPGFRLDAGDGIRHHGNGRGTLVAPIRLKEGLAGCLVAEMPDGGVPDDDTRHAVRHLADQVGVALSNAALLDELDDLTWGALTALARSIDAKSAWTAGHTERVTGMAVAIGRRMELDPGELERLERGAILHDIGKIGVPARILDKPGSLDDEEWEAMKSHTVIGARILEPIPQYEDVVPLVRSHHERWDGSGYPDGLAREDIPRLARLLSVADAFDAMTSDRPYRSGMSVERALGIVEEEAGRQFDPGPARAMAGLVRGGELAESLEYGSVEEIREARIGRRAGSRG